MNQNNLVWLAQDGVGWGDMQRRDGDTCIQEREVELDLLDYKAHRGS